MGAQEWEGGKGEHRAVGREKRGLQKRKEQRRRLERVCQGKKRELNAGRRAKENESKNKVQAIVRTRVELRGCERE